MTEAEYLKEEIAMQQLRFERLWDRYLGGDESPELMGLLVRVAERKHLLVKRLGLVGREADVPAIACTGVSE